MACLRVWFTAATVLAAITFPGCGGEEAPSSAATTAPHFSLNDIDVVDLTIARAEAKLKAAGWRPLGDRPAADGQGGQYYLLPEDPDWIVCSQRFSTLFDGTRDLDLSAAPSCGTVQIPNLLGKTYYEAEEQALALGLTIDEETEETLVSSKLSTHGWVVCEQDPPPGPADRRTLDDIWLALEPSCS
jgi:PASTA domain